jgi:hypothetical protein
MAMPTVAAMHEDVHERTCEQRQPNKNSEDVGAVLGEQEHATNDQECDQNEPRSRRQEAALSMVLACGMTM